MRQPGGSKGRRRSGRENALAVGGVNAYVLMIGTIGGRLGKETVKKEKGIN